MRPTNPTFQCLHPSELAHPPVKADISNCLCTGHLQCTDIRDREELRWATFLCDTASFALLSKLQPCSCWRQLAAAPSRTASGRTRVLGRAARFPLPEKTSPSWRATRCCST